MRETVPRIYLDHNATTPLDPEVRAEMDACLDRTFGNPSSLHDAGQTARRIVDMARCRVADLIGAKPEEIVFTSGGTEADNLAIFGSRAVHPARRHIVVSAIEHQAVLHPCRHLEASGYAIERIDADRQGRINPVAMTAALRDDTLLVSVMLANNETGVLQPVSEIASSIRGQGALLHTDAVQAVGKIPVDVATLDVDLLTLSSHKMQGPLGIGALYVREGVHIAPILFGGHQERGFRPGTENVAAIAGFGKACALRKSKMAMEHIRVDRLRASFEAAILTRLPDTWINGQAVARLPNTTSLMLPGIDAEMLAIHLDLHGIAVSIGSACSTADHEPSHVLVAMGISADAARTMIRFSFGSDNTMEEVERTVEILCRIIGQLRRG